MRKILFATTVMSAVALSGGMASAQSMMGEAPVGKAANTFMIRLRAIGVIPQDSTSSISTIGGHVSTTATPAPEADFSYFLTDNIALELIAATTKHDLNAVGSALSSGSYKVGSTWVLPPTLLLQYHFMPKSQFSPYVGAGLNVSFFYGSKAANAATHISVSNNVGAAVQAGFDYNFSGHWFANFDVKQIFVNTTASVDALGTTVKAKTALNPTVVGAGIGYRF